MDHTNIGLTFLLSDGINFIADDPYNPSRCSTSLRNGQQTDPALQNQLIERNYSKVYIVHSSLN